MASGALSQMAQSLLLPPLQASHSKESKAGVKVGFEYPTLQATVEKGCEKEKKKAKQRTQSFPCGKGPGIKMNHALWPVWLSWLGFAPHTKRLLV